MQPFTIMTGSACGLAQSGLDTDQIIPARFMKRPRSDGYAEVLFHDLRQDPAFALNDPRHAGAVILAARRNFGGGSSREAAVYALADFGIRCVIAPSFGDIFAANAAGQGLLPAQVTEADGEAILAALAGAPLATVDLQACSIRIGVAAWGFTIDPVFRTKLLNGWDHIDITRNFQASIDAFVGRDRVMRGWAWERRNEALPQTPFVRTADRSGSKDDCP